VHHSALCCPYFVSYLPPSAESGFFSSFFTDSFIFLFKSTLRPFGRCDLSRRFGGISRIPVRKKPRHARCEARLVKAGGGTSSETTLVNQADSAAGSAAGSYRSCRLPVSQGLILRRPGKESMDAVSGMSPAITITFA